MSMPCAYGAREATVQSRIIDLREADVDAVAARARDAHALELDAVRERSTSIPFSPPTTVTFADHDAVGADDDAAADDRARLADERLARA